MLAFAEQQLDLVRFHLIFHLMSAFDAIFKLAALGGGARESRRAVMCKSSI
jgi:hypothetical protein